MRTFTLLIIVSALAFGHSEDAAGATADANSVVPEQVPETAMSQEGFKKANAWDTTDDESDHDAMKHIEADSLGNNPITGEPMSKNDNGMADNHVEYDPTMGRDAVKSPGYTTQDSNTEEGHYYLGSGRRRIGAGFGRRRRAVEMPETAAQKAEDATRVSDIFKDPTKLKALLHFAHQRVTGYHEDEAKDQEQSINTLKNKAKNLMKGLTMKQLLKFNREMLGIASGPTFYSKHNYHGASYTTSGSIADVANSRKIDNNDITSLKVPAGYTVEIFTEKNYEGKSIKFVGPKKVWTLSKTLLELHSGVNSGGSGGDMKVLKGIRTYKTTWDNQAQSIKITKFEFKVHLSKKKCQKTCGMDDYEYTGTVTCLRTGGLTSKATVANKRCLSVGLNQPKDPKSRCSGTRPCSNYHTSRPTARCTTTCGFAGDTKYGKVWCELRKHLKKDGRVPEEASLSKVAFGKHVKDGMCVDTKPPKPFRRCPATQPCYAYKAGPPTGACPGNCGRGASKVYGNMLCYDTTNNKAMSSHTECQNLKLKVPAKKFKKCKGGSWGSGICHIGAPNGHGAGNCYVTPGHSCHEEAREGWDYEERRECLGSGGAHCYGGTINGNTKYMSCYRSGGNCIQSRL